MLVVEIDGLDAQALKAGVAGAAHIFRRAVSAANSIGTDAEAELGGHDQAISRNFAQEAPKQFLILVRAVGFGRVQEISSKLQIPVQNSKRFRLIRRSVGKGHSHATETKRGNLRSI